MSNDEGHEKKTHHHKAKHSEEGGKHGEEGEKHGEEGGEQHHHHHHHDKDGAKDDENQKGSLRKKGKTDHNVGHKKGKPDGAPEDKDGENAEQDGNQNGKQDDNHWNDSGAGKDWDDGSKGSEKGRRSNEDELFCKDDDKWNGEYDDVQQVATYDGGKISHHKKQDDGKEHHHHVNKTDAMDVGKYIRISNLDNVPRFNNRVGKVISKRDEYGKQKVQLQPGDEFLKIYSDKLKVIDEKEYETEVAHLSGALELRRGVAIRTTGLAQMPQFNQEYGRIVTDKDENGKLTIVLENEAKDRLRMFPDKLIPISEADFQAKFRRDEITPEYTTGSTTPIGDTTDGGGGKEASRGPADPDDLYDDCPVKIKNLENLPQFNGRAGRIVGEVESATGKYKIILQPGDQHVKILPDKIQIISETEFSQISGRIRSGNHGEHDHRSHHVSNTHVNNTSITIGCAVRIVGLKKLPMFDGKVGRVLSNMLEEGKYKICTRPENQRLKVYGNRLLLLSEEEYAATNPGDDEWDLQQEIEQARKTHVAANRPVGQAAQDDAAGKATATDMMDENSAHTADTTGKNATGATRSIKTSTENIKTSTGSMKPPSESIKTSTGSVKPSTENIKTSTGSMKPPTESIKTSTGSIKPSTESINTSTGSIKPSTGSIKTSTGTMKPSTGSIKPSSGSIKASTGDIKTSTGSIKTSTGSIKTSTVEEYEPGIAAPFSNPHSSNTRTDLPVTKSEIDGAARRRAAYWKKRIADVSRIDKDLDAKILQILVEQSKYRVDAFYAFEENQKDS